MCNSNLLLLLSIFSSSQCLLTCSGEDGGETVREEAEHGRVRGNGASPRSRGQAVQSGARTQTVSTARQHMAATSCRRYVTLSLHTSRAHCFHYNHSVNITLIVENTIQ